jgi:hypothetical protein
MTDAIRALRLAVEAGEFDAAPDGARRPYFNRFMDLAENVFPIDDRACKAMAWRAYHQHSLDAALALMKAVLPEWSWVGGDMCEGMSVFPPDYDSHHRGEVAAYHPDPARALLLAILKALEAKGDGQ